MSTICVYTHLLEDTILELEGFSHVAQPQVEAPPRLKHLVFDVIVCVIG